MSKTHERLLAYQTQMSIYAEQHKVMLASDVLDMIEQLQDDLKDDVDAVVNGVKGLKVCSYVSCDECQNGYCFLELVNVDDVIEIVRKGGVK